MESSLLLYSSLADTGLAYYRRDGGPSLARAGAHTHMNIQVPNMVLT